MHSLSLRGVLLGEGRPKIAVSLTGKTESELLSEVETLHTLPVDIAEWRLDCFSAVTDRDALGRCLAALRKTLGEIPLLATFRTKQEGGCAALSPSAYLALNQQLLASQQIDLLDIELFAGEAIVSPLIASAHAAGIPVLLSNHDFEKTPSKEELLRRLAKMDALGGDVLKIAVMPKNRSDVLALLAATAEAADRFPKPLVTISMGGLGAVSRMAGGVFGSAMTFAAAHRSSAPGQLPADDLSFVLDLLPSNQA